MFFNTEAKVAAAQELLDKPGELTAAERAIVLKATAQAVSPIVQPFWLGVTVVTCIIASVARVVIEKKLPL